MSLFLALSWACASEVKDHPRATGGVRSTGSGGTLGDAGMGGVGNVGGNPQISLGGTQPASPGGAAGAEDDAGAAGDGGAAGEAGDASAGCSERALPPGGTLELQQAGDLVVLSEIEVLIGQSQENRLDVYDLCEQALARSWQLPAAPGDIAFDRAKNAVFVALKGSTHVARVALDGDEIELIPTSAHPLGLTVVDEDLVLASTDDFSHEPDFAMALVDGEALEERAILYGEYQELLAYNASAAVLFTTGQGGVLTYFAVEPDFTDATLLGIGTLGANCREVVVSPDGKHMVMPCGGGNGNGYTIIDYDAADPTISYGEFDTGPYPTGAAFSDDGEIFVSFGNSYLDAFSVATHALVFREAARNIERVGIAASGRMMFGVGEGVLQWVPVAESM